MNCREYIVAPTLTITENEDNSLELSFVFISFCFSLFTSSSLDCGGRKLSNRLKLGWRSTVFGLLLKNWEQRCKKDEART